MQQKGKTDAHESDLRVRKTRKLLQDALIALMTERSFDSITITDIAEKALVNRATFYRHYRDKYHLSEAVFKDAVDTMMKTVDDASEPVSGPRPRDIQKVWVSLFNHVADNEKLYGTLFGDGVYAAFRCHIRDHIVSIAKRRWEKSRHGTRLPKGQPSMDLPYVFAANLLIGNMIWWIDEGKGYGRDEVIEWTRKFIRMGFTASLKE